MESSDNFTRSKLAQIHLASFSDCIKQYASLLLLIIAAYVQGLAMQD